MFDIVIMVLTIINNLDNVVVNPYTISEDKEIIELMIAVKILKKQEEYL